MKRVAMGLVGVLLAATGINAQEVGRTQWNGYPVVLNADQSWYFDCGGYGASMSKQIRMAFCFDPETWTVGTATGVQEFMYLSNDNTTGVLTIPDGNYYTPEDLHGAVPVSAAQNAGVTVEELGATDAPVKTINGRTWMGTRYMMTIEGTSFSYLDYHTTGPGFGTVQVVFWTVPGDEAEADAKAEVFLNQVVFGG